MSGAAIPEVRVVKTKMGGRDLVLVGPDDVDRGQGEREDGDVRALAHAPGRGTEVSAAIEVAVAFEREVACDPAKVEAAATHIALALVGLPKHEALMALMVTARCLSMELNVSADGFRALAEQVMADEGSRRS